MSQSTADVTVTCRAVKDGTKNAGNEEPAAKEKPSKCDTCSFA